MKGSVEAGSGLLSVKRGAERGAVSHEPREPWCKVESVASHAKLPGMEAQCDPVLKCLVCQIPVCFRFLISKLDMSLMKL